MKKIIWTYGLISGAIVAAMLVLSLPLHEQGVLDFDSGMVVGYATMLIALSLVFFGIRSYRDAHGDGQISFWLAVKIGFLISLIASVLYCIAWEISYHTIAGDFTQRMSEYYIEDKRAAGASPEELVRTRKEMDEFENMYRNPLVRFGYTLFEILPVGLVVTLISAAALSRKKIPQNLPPSV